MHALTLGSGDDASGLPFRVSATGRGVAVIGDLDYFCADVARRVLVEAVDRVVEPVIDVSRLKFFDVAGMRAIVSAAGVLHIRREAAVVRGASPLFHRVWSMFGYDSVARIEVARE